MMRILAVLIITTGAMVLALPDVVAGMIQRLNHGSPGEHYWWYNPAEVRRSRLLRISYRLSGLALVLVGFSVGVRCQLMPYSAAMCKGWSRKPSLWWQRPCSWTTGFDSSIIQLGGNRWPRRGRLCKIQHSASEWSWPEFWAFS